MISLPRLNTALLSNKRAEMTARRIASDLRLVREMAMAKRTSHFLQLTPALKEYTLYEISMVPTNRLFDKRIFQNSIQLTGDLSYEFVKEGALAPGSGASLSVVDGSHQWTVSVVPLTGLVRISTP